MYVRYCMNRKWWVLRRFENTVKYNQKADIKGTGSKSNTKFLCVQFLLYRNRGNKPASFGTTLTRVHWIGWAELIWKCAVNGWSDSADLVGDQQADVACWSGAAVADLQLADLYYSITEADLYKGLIWVYNPK